MKTALAVLLAFSRCHARHGRGNTSHFIDKLSCDSGPDWAQAAEDL